MKSTLQLSAHHAQRMALLPTMLQSIEMLQLSTVDVLARIDAELQRNEALELVRPERRCRPDARVVTSAGSRSRSRDADTGDALHAALHNAPAPGPDLMTHVRAQLAWRRLSDELRDAVLLLASGLDASGFLTDEAGELRARVGTARFDEAIAVLHSLEPRGLGARGPIDAMLLQLEPTDPDRGAIETILTRHLEDLARNRVSHVANAIDCTLEEVGMLVERIAELDPRPGDCFRIAIDEPLHVDLEVRTVDGVVEVSVDDLALPVLAVTSDYERMAASGDVDPGVRRYLRDRVRSARELITAVERRKQTLVHVGAALMQRQRAFLERGRAAIRPLRMSDLAADLGLHTSTVSRAVAGKYLRCERGVFALREFFDGARGRDRPGLGRAAVHEQVRELVGAEDPAEPLSDEAIVDRLRARGVRVARRTVAKYRADLGIGSRWERRR